MVDKDSTKWQDAMKSEMDSTHVNKVWTLVNLPKGIVLIRCKQVYKRKIGSTDKMETYKSSMVVKGYSQKEEIDYEKTFSPVVMLKSIQILLAIAPYLNYEIWQMDVNTTFLSRMLEKDIYIVQLWSFED